MKRIGVRELRQNPAQMIRDVRDGEPYTLTDRGEEIATIVPSSSIRLAPPRRRRDPDTPLTFIRRQLQTADSVEQLVDEMKGEW